MTIEEKIKSIFLMHGTDVLDCVSEEFKKQIELVITSLDLEGNTSIKFIYFQPVSGKYHLIEYNVNLTLEDFGEFASTHNDYCATIAFEISLIMEELVNRPCETTCEHCKLKECSRGTLIGDIVDVHEWKKLKGK